jgi:hypothetical protein
MNILKFSRSPQNPFEGTEVPTGIRLAIPNLGYSHEMSTAFLRRYNLPEEGMRVTASRTGMYCHVT